MLRKVGRLLVETGLGAEVKPRLIRKRVVNLRKGTIQDQDVLLLRAALPLQFQVQVNKFNTAFAQATVGLSPATCLSDVTASLKEGDLIQPIRNSACTQNFRRKDLEFEQGKVHLLLFWATQAEPCGPALDFLCKMLKKHPEWEPTLNIKGIVLDKEFPAMVQPHIDTFEFNNVEHVLQA